MVYTPVALWGIAYRNDLQAAAKAITQGARDPDDDMLLPPPARPASRPPLPPSASAHGTRSLHGDDEGPSFEAPDADTIRYTCSCQCLASAVQTSMISKQNQKDSAKWLVQSSSCSASCLLAATHCLTAATKHAAGRSRSGELGCSMHTWHQTTFL